MEKFPHLGKYVKDLVRDYITLEYPGSIHDGAGDDTITYLPKLNGSQKRAWNNRYLARGPVAHMLSSLAQFGMGMDGHLNIRQCNEVPFS